MTPASAAERPSRCRCVAKPFARNLILVDDSSVVLEIVVPEAFFAARETCFSRSPTRRFNPARSERYCAKAFRRPSSSLRISLRANRTISSFKMDAMFGISVPLCEAHQHLESRNHRTQDPCGRPSGIAPGRPPGTLPDGGAPCKLLTNPVTTAPKNLRVACARP